MKIYFRKLINSFNSLSTRSLVYFVFLLFISFFLNYISAIYSNVDLFKFDISDKELTLKKKKIIFVFRNINLLLASVSYFQVIINFLISNVFIEDFLGENKKSPWLILFISIVTAAFTEVFSRYLSSTKYGIKLLNFSFFVDCAYFLTRITSLLFFNLVVDNKGKLFNNSEKDFSTFLNNLVSEKILEEKEGKLVSSALNLDETRVNSIFENKFIFLDYSMNLGEIINIHFDHYFSLYPVFKDNILFGIFNMKKNHKNFEDEKKDNFSWRDKIIGINEIVFVSKNEKLDFVLEKMQRKYTKLSLVLDRKKKTDIFKLKKSDIIGIITIKNISDYLLSGK